MFIIVADPGLISFFDARKLTETLCIGSVLNKNWILTTASCVGRFQGPSQYFLLAGNAKQRSYSIEKIIVHEKYNNIDSENDVALVRLSIPLTFTTSMKPIKLSAELQSSDLRAFEWNTRKNILFITQNKFLPESLLPNRVEKPAEELPIPKPSRNGRFISSVNQVYTEVHIMNPNQLYASSQSSNCTLINGSPVFNTVDNTIVGMASRNCKCIPNPMINVEFVNIPHHHKWIQKNLA